MKALVTGGAGMIGSHLVDRLVQAGWDVVILDNLEPVTHPNGAPDWLNREARFIEGDVSDQYTVFSAASGCDVIFHQAAYGGFDPGADKQMLLANALGTMNVLHAARAMNVGKVVLASSQAVYGDPGWDPVRELDPLRPTTPYGLSKLYAEQYALQYGAKHDVPVVALRYALTYGPRQSPWNPYTGIASIFSRRILRGEAPYIYEDGGQTRDFVYVSDVVAANLLVANDDQAIGAYNVGTGVPTTVKRFAELLCAAYESPLVPFISGEKRAGDARDMITNPTRLRALGWSPSVPIEEGIRRFAEWFVTPVLEMSS
jgi:dTDP-L-rhamnose 4-epimerase